MSSPFRLFPVVEGHGDVAAVPRLLTRILTGAHVEKPHRIPKDKFMNKREERGRCLDIARRRAAECITAGNKCGVLVLMDADEACCADFVRGEKAKEIRACMKDILGDIPHFFALAEKGYESWLAAGFGGDSPGDPKRWLEERFGKYSKIPDQKKLTDDCEFNVERASKISPSFRRFRERVLVLPKQVA